MSDQSNQENNQPFGANPYDVYTRYVNEQNRIWLNWWTQVLKNIWGMNK